MEKRILLTLLSAAACIVLLCSPTRACGQKKAMGHDVYDTWERVHGAELTPDGNILVYMVSPQEGDGSLHVRNMTPAGRKKSARSIRELTVERGYLPALDPQGGWLYCRIKPPFAVSRQEKIRKKKAEERLKDSLAVINLKTMEIKKFQNAESFSTGFDAMPLVAYKSTWKEYKDSTDRKGRSVSGVILLDPAADKADTLRGADKFVFSNDGRTLAFTAKKDKKDSTSQSVVALLQAGQRDTLACGAEEYGTPVFDDQGVRLAFTASLDTNKTGDRRFALSLTDLASRTTREAVAQGTQVAGTDGWTLNQNSVPYFSRDGKRIFIGIAPIRPPKDTSIIDFETARVDIWNWDAPYTPPQQKKNLDRTVKKTYPAVIDTERPDRIVPLTTSFFDDIVLMDGGAAPWALSLDDSAYVRSYVWTYRSDVDVDLVSLEDGSRRQVAWKLNASVRPSPEGKYLLWYDEEARNWFTYDIAAGTTANLTAQAGTAFYDEEDDHPGDPSPYENAPKWIEGDRAVLIADRYDIWKFAPDGSSAENLTAGTGRKGHLRMRTFFPTPVRLTANQGKARMQRTLSLKEELVMSVHQEDDQRKGLAWMRTDKPRTPAYFLDTCSYATVYKAPEAGRIAFQKGNFRHCYDLYLTDDRFATSEKVTAVNPQMDSLRWGHPELFTWNAYDGTPLKGLVFLPDDIAPGEKLPVMIYFYEKYSDQLYNFWTPAPSRSTVNIPFFTSRGYICFIPDIKYEVGHPGQSAYNCICSGAEALCAKYACADPDRMGIQGQSWGGYQVAWLITRTDMFAAAGAGAPVSNMTSAYGGIRWESGITRAGQYERGQSRIGKTLWEEGGLDLYIENSPAFHADKVHTPLLIMHNDADGAVPWYQGIEYFSDLRRLERPVWMVEYNDEAHNLLERRNCIDLSKRLQQFFDHYLKDAPMPAWMKTGVPTDRKGEYFGFENAE